MMLLGLRSRCSTPLACAAARPAHSFRAISTAFVGRQPADALQQRRQILAVDELHRQIQLAVGLADVVDAAHVRVGDLARETHFGPESRARAFIGPKRREEFQRDWLSELEVVRTIDLAHAATSKCTRRCESDWQRAPRHEIGLPLVRWRRPACRRMDRSEVPARSASGTTGRSTARPEAFRISRAVPDRAADDGRLRQRASARLPRRAACCPGRLAPRMRDAHASAAPAPAQRPPGSSGSRQASRCQWWECRPQASPDLCSGIPAGSVSRSCRWIL